MYNFIYYVIYNQQLEKGKSLGFARYNGSLIVGFTLVVHVIFLLSIIRAGIYNWFGYAFGKINVGFGGFFIITIFFIAFSYYNAKKTEKILTKFSNHENPTQAGNYIKIILIIFIPLIIIMLLLKK